MKSQASFVNPVLLGFRSMSSRSRKDRGAPTGLEEQQIWQSVRTHLKSVEKLEQSSTQDLSTLEEKRKDFIQNPLVNGAGKPDDLTRETLTSLYQTLDKRYEDEQRDITKALEKLEVLVAVRDDSSSASKRKKRKTTDRSASGASSTSPPPLLVTPATERNIYPILVVEDSPKVTNSLLAPTPEREKKRSNSKSNVNNTVPATPATPLSRRGTLSNQSSREALNSVSSSTANQSNTNTVKDAGKDLSTAANVSSYIDPARARREVLAHQLPLQKGRKVAFRQPSKNKVGPGAANVSLMTSRSASAATGGSAGQAATATPDDEGETWIMATIIECINNDRNRYVVQDAEDTAMPTYNTTLKAIVPLPESLATLPLEDYKVGTQVMGLYPDTSCFYQATVRGGGPGMNGKVTVKMQRRADDFLNAPYRLEFEDDGGAIHNVPACLIVEKP